MQSCASGGPRLVIVASRDRPIRVSSSPAARNVTLASVRLLILSLRRVRPERLGRAESWAGLTRLPADTSKLAIVSLWLPGIAVPFTNFLRCPGAAAFIRRDTCTPAATGPARQLPPAAGSFAALRLPRRRRAPGTRTEDSTARSTAHPRTSSASSRESRRPPPALRHGRAGPGPAHGGRYPDQPIPAGDYPQPTGPPAGGERLEGPEQPRDLRHANVIEHLRRCPVDLLNGGKLPFPGEADTHRSIIAANAPGQPSRTVPAGIPASRPVALTVPWRRAAGPLAKLSARHLTQLALPSTLPDGVVPSGQQGGADAHDVSSGRGGARRPEDTRWSGRYVPGILTTCI